MKPTARAPEGPRPVATLRDDSRLFMNIAIPALNYMESCDNGWESIARTEEELFGIGLHRWGTNTTMAAGVNTTDAYFAATKKQIQVIPTGPL